MKTPDISVIVPVYNGEKHLPTTIESLLTQTYSDIEVLFLDDGSTDKSAEVIRSYDDPRIRYLHHANQGLCYTLNRGVAEAAAPFIARNDQDDISFPSRLSIEMETLRARPDAIAVYAYYNKVGDKRSWQNKDKFDQSADAVSVLDPLVDGCILGSTLLGRSSILKTIQYRQEYYPSDDYDYEMRLSEIGPVLLLKQQVVTYRFHGGANTYRLFSLMQDKSRWAVQSCHRRRQNLPELDFEAFMKSREQTRKERLLERIHDRAKLHMRLAGQRYLDGKDVQAALHAGLSFVLDPSNIIHRLQRMARKRSNTP